MLAMALLTLYIIALPTLLSAANGYYSVATPSLFYYPTRESMIDIGHLNRTQIAIFSTTARRKAWCPRGP
jgi:hypothetical protein